MKNTKPFLIVPVVTFLISSCTVLTSSQVDLINNLAIASDSVATTPVYIFESLAEIREERGLFYVASLSSPDAHIEEINALAEASIDDSSIINRANVYVNVLNSYLRSLKSISSDIRWESLGRELRGTGRNIDSVLVVYNKLYPENQIETGLAKSIGQYSGFLAQEITKRRQAVIVKEYVGKGDTLVSICCDGLIDLLKKEEIDLLIENEEIGLEANYLAYLNCMYIRSAIPDSGNDRKYLELKKELYNAKKTRTQCLSALRSLKKAHNKVLKELQERKKIDQIYEELLELNDDAYKLFR